MRKVAFLPAPGLARAAALVVAPAEAEGGKGHKGKGGPPLLPCGASRPCGVGSDHGYRRTAARGLRRSLVLALLHRALPLRAQGQPLSSGRSDKRAPQRIRATGGTSQVRHEPQP